MVIGLAGQGVYRGVDKRLWKLMLYARLRSPSGPTPRTHLVCE